MFRELSGMVAWFRNFRAAAGARAQQNSSGSGDAYIALAPSTGIPAATSSGTGSGLADLESPGNAICTIWKIGADNSFDKISGLRKTVYNLSQTAVEADTWVLVTKDKFGSWIATSGGGDAGELQSISFDCITDVSFDPDTCEVTYTTNTVTITGRDLTSSIA